MSGEGEREGFLARWSRRKRAAEAGKTPEPAVPPPPPPETPPAAAEEPEFDLSSLPKIEDLTAESDLRPFFAKGVPAALRQAALSRIWSLDPAIRDFVGPADYAWDFNAPDGVPGFGFDLPEEAKALARRLLGVDREEQDQAERAAAAATAAPTAAEAPGAPQQAAAIPPETPPPAFLPPDAAPVPPAEAAPESAPQQPAATPMPRRRHGSALPA
ncbi:MAG: DUF3306 domain-containing protein [Acetobacteraceae bacterium]|nr:DUF3306 domain-containing protein [Acetobacteraceae bacterium]